jgi:hypothetical protein
MIYFTRSRDLLEGRFQMLLSANVQPRYIPIKIALRRVLRYICTWVRALCVLHVPSYTLQGHKIQTATTNDKDAINLSARIESRQHPMAFKERSHEVRQSTTTRTDSRLVLRMLPCVEFDYFRRAGQQHFYRANKYGRVCNLLVRTTQTVCGLSGAAERDKHW